MREGGFGLKTGFLSENDLFQYNRVVCVPALDGEVHSPGLYIDRGARNLVFRCNLVIGCDYSVEMYLGYTDYSPVRKCDNITLDRCYMHGNNRNLFDGTDITLLPSASTWGDYPLP